MADPLLAIRSRLRLRQRLRGQRAIKGDEEIAWWVREWEPALRSGGFLPDDVLSLLGEADAADTYEGRRWQQARAEVVRVTREARLEDPSFFAGKVVVDIGPGPLGFPDACPARVSIGIDPLAERYAARGLLLASDAVYLSLPAEHLPFVSDSVDVVLARNSLDHIDDPPAVLREARRVLRPGGTLILNFDVEHTPTSTEPHSLTTAGVKGWLGDLEVVHEDEWTVSHGDDGHAVVLVARKAGGRGAGRR